MKIWLADLERGRRELLNDVICLEFHWRMAAAGSGDGGGDRRRWPVSGQKKKKEEEREGEKNSAEEREREEENEEEQKRVFGVGLSGKGSKRRSIGRSNLGL
ncbi:MAG: hypothetical protein Q8807_02985 ['Waltheria sp.' little leaf phytoplasma]|nr:hypothetical protein ['Waltheria sp.' little leaf phytoplasma]